MCSSTAQFTGKPINETVDAESEATFSYAFRMDPSLQPIKLQMTLFIFYTDGEEQFSDAFFNQTVDFVEGSGSFAPTNLMPTLVGFGILATCAWAFYALFIAPAIKKKHV